MGTVMKAHPEGKAFKMNNASQHILTCKCKTHNSREGFGVLSRLWIHLFRSFRYQAVEAITFQAVNRDDRLGAFVRGPQTPFPKPGSRVCRDPLTLLASSALR